MKRLFFQDNKVARAAEKLIHEHAQIRKFKDWWDWYETERKDLSRKVSDLGSMNYLLGVCHATSLTHTKEEIKGL